MGVGIEEDHADAQRFFGGPGVLEATEHAKNAVAVREQADWQVTAAALLGNQFCEFTAGQRESIPGAVSFFLFGGQCGGRNWSRLDTLILEQFLDSALLQI